MAMIDHKIHHLLLQKVRVFCQSGTEITKFDIWGFFLSLLFGREGEGEEEG